MAIRSLAERRRCEQKPWLGVTLQSQQPSGGLGGSLATVSEPLLVKDALASCQSALEVHPAPCKGPCRSCGSAIFWFDVYGGGPHCRGCNAPPTRSLIGSRLVAADTDVGHVFEILPQINQIRRGAHRTALDDSRATLGDECVTWRLASGETMIAIRGRVGPMRVASEGGRYCPPLVCGPVGDLSIEEWFERLPDFPSARPG